MKEDAIELDGEIIEALPGTSFKVRLDSGAEVHAYLCGRMYRSKIHVLLGDRVKVSLSPYDLTRGRVVQRH